MPLTYHPAVFHVNDIAQAMAVIMTPEGSTTAERWEIETPYLADLIAQELTITPDTLLLDYGCGIGRLAYELIQAPQLPCRRCRHQSEHARAVGGLHPLGSLHVMFARHA